MKVGLLRELTEKEIPKLREVFGEGFARDCSRCKCHDCLYYGCPLVGYYYDLEQEARKLCQECGRPADGVCQECGTPVCNLHGSLVLFLDGEVFLCNRCQKEAAWV